MNLFCVGKFREPPALWEFVGVFSTRELAIAQCRSPEYFVAPCVLDEAAPDATTEWQGAFYPIAGTSWTQIHELDKSP